MKEKREELTVELENVKLEVAKRRAYDTYMSTVVVSSDFKNKRAVIVKWEDVVKTKEVGQRRDGNWLKQF